MIEIALGWLLSALRGGATLPSVHEIRSAEHGREVIDGVGRQPAERVPRAFHAVALTHLLVVNLPEQEPLLAPWLVESSLSMVHAYRGVGKTWFGLNVAYAVATGGKFLNWTAPEPRNVLYLDGEMPGKALQTRLRQITDADERDIEIDGDRLQFLTPDLLEGPLPDLGSVRDQEVLQDLIAAVSPALIVVDNISCLVRSGAGENDAESWLPVQDWALRMRRDGIAVVFIHHQGKGGRQRGTSKKEDVLDTVIGLKRPSEYRAEDGAAFAVEFDKARHIHGEDAASFEARLEDVGGRLVWTMRNAAESKRDRIVDLAREGMSVAEIAVELDMHRSNVYRTLNSAIENRILPADILPAKGRRNG